MRKIQTKMIVYTATLIAVCCVGGGLLAFAFHSTEPLRIKASLERQEIAQRTVLPLAVSFNALEASGHIAWAAYDQKGVLCGYVIKVATRGYSSTIELLVGVDVAGVLTGVTVLAQQETPGFGTRMEEPWFTRQFIAKKVTEIALRKDGGSIDAITGATISSRAVANGLQREIAAVLLEIRSKK